jgi:secreted PhoX family phosphatase
MGRFSHEAVAFDPRTLIVYQTEDRGDSLFYRFLANVPGQLQRGGKLQALKLTNGITDARNHSGPVVPVGEEFAVEWIDIVDVESPQDNLRAQGASKGATIFSREEGCWWGNGAVYFACTDGGPSRLGQIFKYTPSPFEGTSAEKNTPGKLELFIESNSSAQFEAPDNITIAPWGDVIICEDGSGDEFVHGVTPNGEVYKIARNATNTSEFAGACFSPDGATLFVNIQSPGITFAITGPWQRRAGSNPANGFRVTLPFSI